MKKHLAIFGLVLACLVSSPILAQTEMRREEMRRVLTLSGAKRVLAATLQRAAELQAPGGTIAVVDDGGHLMLLERMENTFAASPPIAIGKARTAALFRKPTKFFEEVIHDGRTSMVTLPDFTPLQGGIPLMIDDQVVGAIGVSGGASAAQDQELAEAGAAAMSAESVARLTSAESHISTPAVERIATTATLFPHDEVSAAWEAGRPLLETDEFKIHASRRDQPGLAELHERETDVGYVMAGRATLVTGGQIVDAHTTSDGEVRGSGIEGGETMALSPGDVFVVPRGTPHWFREVDAPFLYFVVKPIATEGENR